MIIAEMLLKLAGLPHGESLNPHIPCLDEW